MRNALCLMLLALFAIPASSPADKKDDELAEIQRDVAQVDEEVRGLQKAQAAQAKQLEDLHTLIQQSAAASAQAAQDLAALKTALTTNIANALADQQNKITQSVAPLGSRMDNVSTSVDQLNSTIGAINDRIAALDKKLSNINDKVSTINQPPPAPPAAPNAVPVPDTTGNVPPGVSKPGLQEDATRDYTAGNNDMALTELANYVKYWPMDSWTPTAGYLIGMVYKRTKDYDSATQAFQSVIDNYPSNNMAQDALFQKGMALADGNHKTDAIRTLKEFVEMYPVNDNVPNAKQELNKLTGAAGKNSSKGRGAAKQN
jgi:TolA-binding protein